MEQVAHNAHRTFSYWDGIARVLIVLLFLYTYCCIPYKISGTFSGYSVGSSDWTSFVKACCQLETNRGPQIKSCIMKAIELAPSEYFLYVAKHFEGF